jgi:hypothetical protein
MVARSSRAAPEVAQFIYLLLNREKIRDVINAVTRRGVLLLGQSGDGGLALLQAIAAWLRTPENGGYLPLLFDFPRPESKTYTETIGRWPASLALSSLIWWPIRAPGDHCDR